MKEIQLFLVGDTTAEVAGELVSLELGDFIKVTHKDGDEVYSVIFPREQVRQIRLYDEGEE